MIVSLCLTALMMLATPVYSVIVEMNVPYATVPGYWTHAPVGDKKATSRLLLHSGRMKPVTLDMDIYLPDGDARAKRPLLLMIHGGSFFIGNKEEPGQAGWCRHFASLGYVAASINYRLGFHPAKKEVREAELRALEDADTALAYLLSREDLRIDPRRVFLAGTSSGAITALNLAYRLYGEPQEEGLHPRLAKEDFHIAAVANLWGSVHDLAVLERARVPILSFQSVNDPMVPYDEGYPFRKLGKLSGLLSDYMYGTHAIHEKALSLGIRAEHHPCAETGHRIHLDDKMEYTPRFAEIRDAMAAFFAASE